MLHWTPDFILHRLREMLVSVCAGTLHQRFGASFRHGSMGCKCSLNALLHGDLVVIQEVGGNMFFSFKEKNMLLPTSCLDVGSRRGCGSKVSGYHR